MTYIAFFDWDGTLSADGRTVSEQNLAALAAFRAAGNMAVLCTGRSLAYIPASAWTRIFDGVVAACGSTVIWAGSDGICRLPDGSLNGEWLFRRFLPDPLLREVLETYAALPQVTCILEGETDQYYLSPAPHMRTAPFQVLSSPDDFFDRFAGQKVSKFSVYGCPSVPPNLGEKLVYIRNDLYGLQEALLPGCGKADGMRRLLEALSLPREAAIAFGDSPNDSDMLAYAAVGVAMGNASEDIKALADRVAPPAPHSGVAAVLREYIE